FDLNHVRADIRLRAERAPAGIFVRVGTTESVVVELDQAIEVVVGLLATLQKKMRHPEVRARGPHDAKRRRVPRKRASKDGRRGPSSFETAAARPSQNDGLDSSIVGTTPEPGGRHSLRDGTLALGIGLPFGHTDATLLMRLI